MLLEQDDVDIHAIKRQGMTIRDIARRIDHARNVFAAFAKHDGVSMVACRTRSDTLGHARTSANESRNLRFRPGPAAP